MRIRPIRFVSLVAATALLGACSGGGSGDPSPVFGFSPIPPRPDQALALVVLEQTVDHSNAGLIQLSIPWDVLLAGTSAEDEVRQVRLPLADYYRAHGMAVVVALDVTNGLDRRKEDPLLVAANRSITEVAIQDLFRAYVQAVDSLLHPEYLSLAAETNLIRLAAEDPDVYPAVVAMVRAAEAALVAQRSRAARMVSVQVETAWGGLQGTGTFVGISQDRSDFPFIALLGLSSYPYLGGIAQPSALPDDYYARLVDAPRIPVMVLEGGWPSVDVAGVTSTPALQADYIRRQAALLERADGRGVFQITFTDLDVARFPPGVESFAANGLVDLNLAPKAALAAWDEVHRR